jgi:hypothetical protein
VKASPLNFPYSTGKAVMFRKIALSLILGATFFGPTTQAASKSEDYLKKGEKVVVEKNGIKFRCYRDPYYVQLVQRTVSKLQPFVPSTPITIDPCAVVFPYNYSLSTDRGTYYGGVFISYQQTVKETVLFCIKNLCTDEITGYFKRDEKSGIELSSDDAQRIFEDLKALAHRQKPDVFLAPVCKVSNDYAEEYYHTYPSHGCTCTDVAKLNRATGDLTCHVLFVIDGKPRYRTLMDETFTELKNLYHEQQLSCS